MTPVGFFKFAGREEKYGIDEAIRSSAIEAYTVSSLVDIIERNGWSEEVDLVNGGNVSLLCMQDETKTFEKDFEGAKAAGLNLDGVQWLPEEEVNKVGITLSGLSPLHYTCAVPLTDLWDIVSRGYKTWLERVATQTSHKAIRTCHSAHWRAFRFEAAYIHSSDFCGKASSDRLRFWPSVCTFHS